MTKYLVLSALVLNINVAIAKTVSDVAITGEKVEFSAKSNLSAIEINGASKNSSGSVKLSESGNAMTLESLKIVIPVDSLSTGIAIRDHHMKDKIFKTEDGKLPDVTFESTKSTCEKTGEGFLCQAQGVMSLHGQSHETSIPVTISKKGEDFVAQANFELGLRDFGIEPPTHFGVSIENNVGLKTVFRGKVVARHEIEHAVPIAKKEAAPAPAPVVEVVPPVEVQSMRAPASSEPTYAEDVPKEKEQGIVVQLKDGTLVRGLNFEQVEKLINSKRGENRLVLSE